MYSILKYSFEYEFVDGLITEDMIEFSKNLLPNESLWEKWREQELERTQYLDNVYIFNMSKSLMERNNTINSILRILDVKLAQNSCEDNPILTYEEISSYCLGQGIGVHFKNDNVRANEVKLIIAKTIKYNHIKLQNWGNALERRWDSNYRSFNQNCISLIGSYCGAMSEAINILSLFIVFLLIKNAVNIHLGKN